MIHSLKILLTLGASLFLCACSTVTITPQKKASLGRVGVTTGISDHEIIAGRLGFTVFGNKSGSLSSNRYGLPDAVDRAVVSQARMSLGGKAVLLGTSESQRLVNELESNAPWVDFMGIASQQRAGKIIGEAARRNGLDAILIVKPASVYFHDNLPRGQGYGIMSGGDKAYAHVRFVYALIDARTAKIVAGRYQPNAGEIPNAEEWEQLINESNSQIGPIFLGLISKNVQEGFHKMGL